MERFEVEVGKLKEMFVNNGYPADFFYKSLEKFWLKTSSHNSNCDVSVKPHSVNVVFNDDGSTNCIIGYGCQYPNEISANINGMSITFSVTIINLFSWFSEKWRLGFLKSMQH